MKYYLQLSFILCAALLGVSVVNAQDIQETQTDSIAAVAEESPKVQGAFRKIPESQFLGGATVVDMTELIEKNYTTYSLDNMQALVGGWTGGSLWGMNEILVLVDGIPRDASNVMPTEIEQITFLKSAAAVMLYGSRAAKGVVYITTKRGTSETLRINVRANTGFHVSKSYPKYLGSA